MKARVVNAAALISGRRGLEQRCRPLVVQRHELAGFVEAVTDDRLEERPVLVP